MRLSALLAVPIALVGLAVPAYAEDPGLTVTWPAITDVEVPTTSYTINVADTSAEPQGTLYAEWQGERQEIPHTGDYTVNFTKGGTGTIKVVRCVTPIEPPGDPVCTDTGDVSPTITVWKSFFLGREQVSFGGRPGDTVKFLLSSVAAAGTTLAAAWRLSRSWPTEKEYEGVSHSRRLAPPPRRMKMGVGAHRSW